MRVYHDFASPLSRLAAAEVVRWAESRWAESRWAESRGTESRGTRSPVVRWVPFELSPPGAPALDPADPAFAAELETARERAAEWGVEVNAPRVGAMPRTRKAHEAVAFARRAVEAGEAEPGLDTRLVARYYDALWNEGRDIARLDVLVELAGGAGADIEKLYVALGLDDLAAEVVAEQEAAEAAGVPGVPTLVRPVQAGPDGGTDPGPREVLVGLVERNVLAAWLAGDDIEDEQVEG